MSCDDSRNLIQDFYSKNYVQLLGFLQSKLGDRQTAEDLLHDAMVNAVRSIEAFDRNRDFGAWFYGILRNTMKAYLRSRYNNAVVIGSTTVELGDPSMDQMLKDIEASIDFKQLSQCLSPLSSTLVELNVFHQYSSSEFAHMADLSLATIEKRISRAKGVIRNRYYQP